MRRWQSGRLRVTVNHVVKRGGSNPSRRTKCGLIIEPGVKLVKKLFPYLYGLR